VNNRVQLLSAHKDIDISSKIFKFECVSAYMYMHVVIELHASMQILFIDIYST
jgi:hypothetical protein